MNLTTTRSSHSGIFQNVSYGEQIRSVIDIWRNEGYMPDARSSNYNGRRQGGSNADNLFGDAYVKGVRDAVNWTAGYESMLKDAKVQPANNHDPQAPDSSAKESRSALPDRLMFDYITPNYTRAVSCAVEYSANEFAVHVVAAGLGNDADAAEYLTRSRNWRNHWDASVSSVNYIGFVVPRNGDGTFVNQDPLSCGGCYWGEAFYEAIPRE